MSSSSLSYRPCVGIMIFNSKGKVFIAKRKSRNGTITPSEKIWQMPQGGIDPDEDAQKAAIRELYEETNITSADVICQTDDWLYYDLPETHLKKNWRGKYKGQRQRWFLFKFLGDDNEIDVLTPAGGEFEAEFTEWRWETIDKVPELVVEFKKEIYDTVVKIFSPVIAANLG